MGTISFSPGNPDKYYTTITTESYNVTNATQTVLAANPDRKYAAFMNDSDTSIYLETDGNNAVADAGFLLDPKGAGNNRLEVSRLLGNCFLGAVEAIHGSTGNKVLLVVEGS